MRIVANNYEAAVIVVHQPLIY